MPKDIRDAAASPDGERVAVGTDSGEVIIWEVRDDMDEFLLGQKLNTLSHGVTNDAIAGIRGVESVHWSRDGRYLATMGMVGEFTLQIWEIATSKPILRAGVGTGAGAAWSPIQNTLAVTSSTGIRLLEVEKLTFTSNSDLDYQGWVAVSQQIGTNIPDQSFTPVEWNATATQIAVADWFGKVWMIDVTTGVASLFGDLQPLTTPDRFVVTSLVWHEQQFCGGIRVRDYDEINKTGITSSEVRCWDVATKAVLQTFESDATYLRAIDLQGGKLVFGDVASNTRSTNLIESGAVQIVDLAQ